MAEFPGFRPWHKVIIAMKGLPCTGKSEIAKLIGEWARCSPVFSIDDFLSTVSLEKGYNSELMPSGEEAERLQRLAFDALCKSAYHFLNYRNPQWAVVVIKSRLCSTFELDCLLQLSRGEFRGEVTIIIIECHVKNEHRLGARLEYKANKLAQHKKEWYKPRTRNDFEKAKDDWLSDAHNWYLHLSNLINAHEQRPKRVIRLVFDLSDDLVFNEYGINSLTPAFQDAFSYLLTRARRSIEYYPRAKKIIRDGEDEWIGEEIIRDRYEVVQFHKLRHYLVDKELQRASSDQKSIYLCPTSRVGKCCVFKTYTKDEADDDDYNCGVCDERVVSEGYTCHFCFLTLHKSCAEHQGVTFQEFSNHLLISYPNSTSKYLPRTYACKSCREGGKLFSEDCNSCLFETHLKCRTFSTIIKHDCHREHFLSLQVGESLSTSCKACGANEFVRRAGKYGCYVCGLYYCLPCVLRPGKVEHNHGGHEHVLELVYSRDGMEPQEDYWCSVCYENMDPDYWFYSCPDCPCYEAHPRCIMPIP